MSETIVLYFGDIFGKPGRRAVAAALPNLIAEHSPDFIIGNVENLAGGRGVNKKTYNEMVALGFHGFTSGNHIWDNKDVLAIMESDSRLLRPANYPSALDFPCPGKGVGLLHSRDKSLLLINLMGRVFMDSIDCPFMAVDKILRENKADAPILVDMHADATSEKAAMGWFLDGKVTAVVGSHSHVQTADERLLPGGTAYITDVGLTGSFDSCIGLVKDEIIRKFLTKRPQHYQVATGNLGVCCVIIRIGRNNKATSIERLRFPVKFEGFSIDKDQE